MGIKYQDCRRAILAIVVAVLAMPAAGERDTGASNNREDSKKDDGSRSEIFKGEPIDLANLPRDLEQAFLLTPDERVGVRRQEQEIQNATFQPLKEVKPLHSVVRLEKSAAVIPEIKVVPDYPASVVFTDMTGQPWPIRHIAQTASVATVEPVSGSSNSLAFYAKNHSGNKSVSVFLQGMELPITLKVVANEDEYHSVKNVQITEQGPNSNLQSALMASSTRGTNDFQVPAPGGQSIDQALNKMAYRVTPEGFKRVDVSDPDSVAWIEKQDQSKLYLLTPHVVAAPAPINGGDSVIPLRDGVSLYVLPRINPVMVLNASGQRLYLNFQE